jgi:hypothetical protein
MRMCHNEISFDERKFVPTTCTSMLSQVDVSRIAMELGNESLFLQ